jgi:dTDP-4-dehydrorhamnose 3,5-epimerase
MVAQTVSSLELPGDVGPLLAVPECPPGVGSLVMAIDSTDLIQGVGLKSFPLWPDDRGYFLEVARMGQGLPAEFSSSSTQVSAALSYPGTIKAFHYHRRQTDFWVPAMGMLQVALVDLRSESKTFGRKNTLFVGGLRPWHILIPPGVAHGYKVIGATPAMLVYVTDQVYNPSDEGRIPYDDPSIRYDWETQHK